MTATTLYASQCTLGESPFWHARKKCFYWVDINAGVLYSLDWQTNTFRNWEFDDALSLVVETVGDDLLLALGTSVVRFNTDTGSITQLVDLEPDKKNQRCNDGAVDAKGRLWIGTTQSDHDFEGGNLYSIQASGNPQIKIEAVTISNGIVWSLDNKKMYFIDSPTQRIDAYHFNQLTGEIHFDKTAIVIPTKMGTPDGMTIDTEGMLWVAHWGGFGVYRWNPSTGACIGKVEVPVPHVTSCCFAGEHLDQLVITTARKNLDKIQLEQHPESGNLFIVDTGVKGLGGFRFPG